MKRARKWIVGLLLCFLVFVVGFEYAVTSTYQSPLAVLRAEADEDAATLAACLDLTTLGNFANKPTTAVSLHSSAPVSYANGIEIYFCGGTAADETFSWALYLWRSTNGPARLVAYGTGTLGTQAVIIYPQGGAATNKFWADTLTVTWTCMNFSVSTGAVNSVATLQGDARGYQYVDVKIYNANDAGAEAGDITAYYAYY